MYFGNHGGYKVLVLKLLGPTLAELKEVTGSNKLFAKTILKIAIQAVNLYKYHLLFILSYSHKNSLIRINISDRYIEFYSFKRAYCL